MRILVTILFLVCSSFGAAPSSTVPPRVNGNNVTESYDVKWFGADATGVTNSTTAFTDAKNACPVGGVLTVGPGTYMLDGFVVDKDISFNLHPKAILKHKANSTTNMIQVTASPSGIFQGGVLDGNMANQNANLTNWHSLLVVYAPTNYYRYTVQNTVFTNYILAGLQGIDSQGLLTVLNCKFLDGRQHGGISNLQTSAINIRSYLANSTSTVEIASSEFFQSALPSDFGTANSSAPGGAIFSGGQTNNSANAWIMVNFHDNILTRVGQTKLGSHIGAVDYYSGILDGKVKNNKFINCLFNSAKIQNTVNTDCSGNTFFSDVGPDGVTSGFVIEVDPYERQDTGTITIGGIIVKDNIIKGYGSQPAISVLGINAPVGSGCIVANNFITNCASGISVANIGGRVEISGNQVWQNGGGAAALQLNNNVFPTNQTDAVIFGNSFIATNVTGASILGTNCTVNISQSFFETDGAGWTALNISGVKDANVSTTRTSGKNSAVPARVRANGANHTARLNWDFSSNTILNGSPAFTLTEIDEWVGIIVNSTAFSGNFNAKGGILGIRSSTDNNLAYLYTSGTVGSSVWRKLELNNATSVSADGVTVTPGYSHYFLDSTAGAFTLPLPATPESGETHSFQKISSDTNIVTIARNGKTIDGLSQDLKIVNQWQSVMIRYDNARWSVVAIGSMTRNSKSASYDIQTGDSYITFTSSATATLPTANSVIAGKSFTLKSKGSVTITVARSGSDTIETLSQNDSIGQNGCVTYRSDGVSNWEVQRSYNPDVQVYTTTGANTWTKPIGAKWVEVVLVGGGGGGGAGRRGPSLTAQGGGAGGSGGATTRLSYRASDLQGTATATVGAGGGGAPLVSGSDANGGTGTNGISSTFLDAGNKLGGFAGGGGGGNGGQSATGGTAVNGNRSNGMWPGNAAGAGAASGASAGSGGGGGNTLNGINAGGGGGGGGISADGTTASAGGAGGAISISIANVGAPAGGGANGNAGQGTATASGSTLPGGGGPGGGANASGIGGGGANGDISGGGGGGGGACLTGSSSGAGGNGADGVIVVTTWF